MLRRSRAARIAGRLRLAAERLDAVPFRWRLLASGLLVVTVTIGLMLVPAYLSTRRQVAETHRARLAALAQGAAYAIPAGRVDSLAAAGPGLSVPYILTRDALRTFQPDAPEAAAGEPVPATGLALVRRTREGWRVLAHTGWTEDAPEGIVRWTPPPGLADSLGTIRAGRPPLWWLPDGRRLVAAAPILDSTVPVGVVVATLDADAAVADAHRALLRLAPYPLLALALATLLSLLLVRQLTRRVTEVAGLAGRIAGGDLRAPAAVAARDELGRLHGALRDAALRLSGIVVEVRGGAESVASAAEHLTATSQAVAEGGSRQMVSVGEVSAGLSQMSASIALTARNAREMEGAALDGARDAEEGRRAVAETGEAMRRIAEWVGVVRDIARRVDLLSLNAAIEAARAGEHGRGFGVVAEEVRRLSERTEAAAAEIDALVRTSTGVAERSGALLEALAPSIRHAAELVQEVTAATQQQAASVDEISGAMARVEDAAHGNAASAQELAATAEEMAAQAAALRETIALFRVDAPAEGAAGVERRGPDGDAPEVGPSEAEVRHPPDGNGPGGSEVAAEEEREALAGVG